MNLPFHAEYLLLVVAYMIIGTISAFISDLVLYKEKDDHSARRELQGWAFCIWPLFLVAAILYYPCLYSKKAVEKTSDLMLTQVEEIHKRRKGFK